MLSIERRLVGAYGLAFALFASSAFADGPTGPLPGKPWCASKPVAANLGVQSAEQPANTWRETCGSSSTYNPYGAATYVDHRFVLFAGGVLFPRSGPTLLRNAQVYDKLRGAFANSPAMNFGRQGHTLTRLSDGRILVAGGGSKTAELFSIPGGLVLPADSGSAMGGFATTGAMAIERFGHTATLLNDGKVLIAGGGACVFCQSGTDTAELYDPATGTFGATGNLLAPLSHHAASLLPDGRVLVAGGFVGGAPTDIAQIYDPATGQFSYAGTMTTPRRGLHAVALANGSVLLAGGDPPNANTLETYNPFTGVFSAAGSVPDSLFLAERLGNQNVLLISYGSGPARVYAPASGALADTGPYAAIYGMALETVGAALEDGRYLLLNAGEGVGQIYQP
jgi:hypothetical protein